MLFGGANGPACLSRIQLVLLIDHLKNIQSQLHTDKPGSLERDFSPQFALRMLDCISKELRSKLQSGRSRQYRLRSTVAAAPCDRGSGYLISTKGTKGAGPYFGNFNDLYNYECQLVSVCGFSFCQLCPSLLSAFPF